MASARAAVGAFFTECGTYMRGGCVDLTNPTLCSTLSALAAGRLAILALDLEFFCVRYRDGSVPEQQYVSSGDKTAVFPREIGGHLILSGRISDLGSDSGPAPTAADQPNTEGDPGRPRPPWRYCGRFHMKLPSPQNKNWEVAHVPSATMTVTPASACILQEIDREIFQGRLPQDLYTLFPSSILPLAHRALMERGVRVYQEDPLAVSFTIPPGSLRPQLAALLGLISESKIVIKEHTDLDALHNMCALHCLPRPWSVSAFDVAASNGVCRAQFGSARLQDMYTELCQDPTFLAELHAIVDQDGEAALSFKAHNPETDAFMALMVGLVMVQSLSWAFLKRARSRSLQLQQQAWGVQ